MKFEILTVGRLKRAELHHRAKFGRNRSNRGRDMAIFYFFQDGRRPPSFPRWRPSAILDLLCVCSDHPRMAFGGLNRCAKFVGIDGVVLIICMFFDFAGLAWKRLFPPQNWDFTPKWGAISTKTQKRHSESASFESSCAKIRRRIWPVGEFQKRHK